MGNTNSTTTNDGSVANEDSVLKNRREMILEEIIQTEKNYLNYLSVVQEVYIDPLRDGQQKIIKEKHIKAIFLTEPLLEFHVNFFTELAVCYNNFSWSNNIVLPNSLTMKSTNYRLSTVSTTTTTFETATTKPTKLKEITSLESTIAITEIFNRNQENFKIYSNYIIGYDASSTLLAKMKKKKEFSNFIEKCKSDRRCNGLDLGSILIMPVQRLPRYVLLLNELLKNTPEGHGNAKVLLKCLKNLKEVTSYINEAKRDDDNSIKTVQLQDTLIDKVNINETNRKYVFDGEFTIHSIYPLKEEDALLKRLKKFRSIKVKSSGSNAMTEQQVFPDEYKVSKETIFYSFNDCLVLLQKGQKSIMSFNSKQIWSVVDVSLSSKIKVIDVLDVGFKEIKMTSLVLLFTEKSIYLIQLKGIEKEKFIKTLLMTKATFDWKDGTSGSGCCKHTQTTSSNGNHSDELPSILSLRPGLPEATTTITTSTPSSSSKSGFFSSLTPSSSSSSSSLSSSTSSTPSPTDKESSSHKKSRSTTISISNGNKTVGSKSHSSSNAPTPRKSMFFSSLSTNDKK